LEVFLRKFPLTLFIAFGLVLATAPAPAQLRFELLRRPLIEERLKSFGRSNQERVQTMHKLFAEAGCSGDKLTEQPVPHLNQPNLVCVLRGTGDAMVLVGAHFDLVDEGDGVADNWSGASLLPSLYQTLSRRPLQHTYVFIAFSGEEKGLVGSEYYVKKLTKEEKARIHAMVNIDTLGLTPTKVWVSHADEELVRVVIAVANAIKSPVLGMNVEKAGSTDSDSFFEKKIPAINFHSVTQETWSILHSPRDNINSIQLDDYYESYRLITAYVTYLDDYLSRPKEERPFAKKNKD
jgi:hypothetical protein